MASPTNPIPKFSFCIDTTLIGNAWYNADTKDIKVRDEYVLTRDDILEEELFHAFQDRTYPGGIAQYAVNNMVNIEFERALYQDIIGGWEYVKAFGTIAPDTVRDSYKDWIKTITASDTKFPTINDTFREKYWSFLDEFNKYTLPQYQSPQLIKLEPFALQNLISNSNCRSL